MENLGKSNVERSIPEFVRIHIDQKPVESPNPTTGVALRALGNIAHAVALFHEVTGNQEDPLVPNDLEPIRLVEDEHFHSGPERDITIIVNGRKKVVSKRKLSFDQVVALAFNPVPTGPNILFTITYRHGPKVNPEGTLTKGETVRIKEGMVFNVTQTDKS